MGASNIRQNYNEECEVGINNQINLCLYAAYTVKSIIIYRSRHDVPGNLSAYTKLSDFMSQQADSLYAYQNLRGGKVILRDIQNPAKDEWGTLLDVFKAVQGLLRNVNQSVVDLIGKARNHSDYHLENYLMTKHSAPLVELIYLTGKHITTVEAKAIFSIEDDFDLSSVLGLFAS